MQHRCKGENGGWSPTSVRCARTTQVCSLFFFFSSRRRHTRFDCDWSSDVCSSDLVAHRLTRMAMAGANPSARDRREFTRMVSEKQTAFQQSWAAMGMQSMVASQDRKSTRLNSSHSQISYAVFCLKKKKTDSALDESCRGDVRTTR